MALELKCCKNLIELFISVMNKRTAKTTAKLESLNWTSIQKIFDDFQNARSFINNSRIEGKKYIGTNWQNNLGQSEQERIEQMKRLLYVYYHKKLFEKSISNRPVIGKIDSSYKELSPTIIPFVFEYQIGQKINFPHIPMELFYFCFEEGLVDTSFIRTFYICLETETQAVLNFNYNKKKREWKITKKYEPNHDYAVPTPTQTNDQNVTSSVEQTPVQQTVISNRMDEEEELTEA